MDKPLFGFGYLGFQGNYMAYQANYFDTNPNSQYRLLADNIRHPLNEFIRITVNYGIVGLFLYLGLLWSILKRIFSTRHSIFFAIFITFIIQSCFSYPLHYAPFWFWMGCFNLMLFLDYSILIKLTLLKKILITGMCLSGIIFLSIMMYTEIRWKRIAVKSLNGQTEQMLPHYEMLYPLLKRNAFYLYNYGAELNEANQFQKSLIILKECQEKFNDYDLQMIMGDNYYNLGDTINAVRSYNCAANMIPCRFMPLYRQFEIYQETGNTIGMRRIAREISGKKVKVHSSIVWSIITEANEFLNCLEN